MNILAGIKKIQEYFPGVTVMPYVEKERNDLMARKLFQIGTEREFENRETFIRVMDDLGLGIKRGHIAHF